MNDTTLAIISVGIPAAISIIGFIITIFTLKKNFQNELVKQKANVQLEKMSVMPYEILVLMQDIIDAGKEKGETITQSNLKEKMDWIFSSIYAYGSSNAIRILAAMQSENYKNSTVPEKADTYRTMAFYVLLTVSVKPRQQNPATGR